MTHPINTNPPPPTAEERARLRELAREKDPRRIGICEEHWHASRIMELRGALLRAVDALDTAERERDGKQIAFDVAYKRGNDFADGLIAASDRIAALEAEVAAAKAALAAEVIKGDDLSNELDDYETAVDDNLEGVIIDSEDGEGNRIERIEFAGAEVDRLRADLARVTAHHVGAMSSATYWHDAQKETAELYNRAREMADANAEALARVTDELAEKDRFLKAEMEHNRGLGDGNQELQKILGVKYPGGLAARATEVMGELAEVKKRLSDEGDRRIAERSAALDDHVRLVTERDDLKRDREKLAAKLEEAQADCKSFGDQIADCNTTLVGIEKALIAAGIELPEDCDYGRAIAEALATSQRDRESLQRAVRDHLPTYDARATVEGEDEWTSRISNAGLQLSLTIEERDDIKRDREKLAAELAEVKRQAAVDNRWRSNFALKMGDERDGERVVNVMMAEDVIALQDERDDIKRDREKLQGERDAAVARVGALEAHYSIKHWQDCALHRGGDACDMGAECGLATSRGGAGL